MPRRSKPSRVAEAGPHITSPIRRHSRKTRELVHLDRQVTRRTEALLRLAALREEEDQELASETDSDQEMGYETDESYGLGTVDPDDTDYIPESRVLQAERAGESSSMDIDVGDESFHGHLAQDDEIVEENPSGDQAPPQTLRETTMQTLRDWQALIPTLYLPYLRFLDHSVAQIFTHDELTTLQSNCHVSNCPTQSLKNFVECIVQGCACETIPQVLVANGLFPTSPVLPKYAVTIQLLDLYRALFERSCDVIHALANALHTVYNKKGFRLLNNEGIPIKDPFRRSIGSAVQWYDALEVHVDSVVKEAIYKSDEFIQDNKKTRLQSPTPLESTKSHTTIEPCSLDDILDGKFPVSPPPTSSMLEPGSGECHPMLRELCPACFGGSHFGRSLQQYMAQSIASSLTDTETRGGDIHLAVDGNFHHRHIAGAGEDIPFHKPKHFVSKSFVDAIGDRLAKAKGRAPKKYTPVVPDIAVDSCRDAHNAAKGDHVTRGDDDEPVDKPRKGVDFDDKGLMALVCRHDIPLLFANIDTPGEQQKFSIALIEVISHLVPLNAVLVFLYDIACIVDRSILKFATSAMHAYGHQWSCQLVYNPRLHLGLGLTDGEGVERLWARLRRLIGVERRSGRSRRIWLIDRQSDAIGRDLREGLGDWIVNRLTKGVDFQSKKACRQVKGCGVSMSVLRREWEDQKATQLSLRAHTPAKLRKEVSKVLALQTDIQSLDDAIRLARKAITDAHATPRSLELLVQLKRTQDTLKLQVEGLYASLNIESEFPELKGVDAEHLILLFLARDLKVNIRKRAVGSFLEWERLDQSVGGRQQTIGTKKHQETRKNISKHKPALMNSLRLFNSYADSLERLSSKSPSIPIPQHLPTDLKSLRESSDLFQDVWITPCEMTIPLWLDSADIRDGIQGMVKLDRCDEERIHLGLEGDHLCNKSLSLLLDERRNQLLHLQGRWRTLPAVNLRLIAAVQRARTVAMEHAAIQSQNGEQSQIRDIVKATPTWDLISISEAAPEEVSQDELIPDRAVQHYGGDETIASDLVASEAAQVDSDSDDEKPPESDEESEEESDVETVAVGREPGLPPMPELPPPIVTWQLPIPLMIDSLLLEAITDKLGMIQIPGDLTAPRHLLRTSIDFDRRDLVPLTDKLPLTSGSVNGLLALLQTISAGGNNVAVFSSFILEYGARRSNDILWRQAKDTEFWHKDIWILPVHRLDEFHWVLAVLVPRTRTILLFDSFGSGPRSWRQDLADINIMAY
ncbi:hypothetical protein C8J56DRAFT_1094564 [Mycena floridula]|nr:hypothetical protein C8J56DRAFT_1094564 [Mycena floridula]